MRKLYNKELTSVISQTVGKIIQTLHFSSFFTMSSFVDKIKQLNLRACKKIVRQ